MNYAIFKAVNESLDADYRLAKAELRRFDHLRIANGLMPDCHKTPEYKATKAKAGAAFKSVQSFNCQHAKRFKGDIKRDMGR